MTMHLPVFVAGRWTQIPPPHIAPWWKQDLFEDTSGVIKTASTRLDWCRGMRAYLDKELTLRRKNDRPDLELESQSKELLSVEKE